MGTQLFEIASFTPIARRSHLAVLVTLCTLISGFPAGCESGKKRDTEVQDPFHVVMVMDMAGLGDRGFNDAGWAGVQKAVHELGVKGDYLQPGE